MQVAKSTELELLTRARQLDINVTLVGSDRLWRSILPPSYPYNIPEQLRCYIYARCICSNFPRILGSVSKSRYPKLNKYLNTIN